MNRSLLLLLVLVLSLESFGQDSSDWLRQPALNSDGTQLAFSFQGDIWTVDTDGGQAIRRTIHECYETFPQWSLDDTQLVFMGNRYGNFDLFSLKLDGSPPQQLTFHSATDGPAKWGPDQQLLFTSQRVFREVEREDEILEWSPAFATPYRKMDALGSMVAPSPDGSLVAFVRGHCRTTREAYRGPANRDIWVYHAASDRYTQITTFDGQDILPDWGPDGQLYFLSAQNGRYNLFVVQINADGSKQGEPTALTQFQEEGIRSFDLSADGRHLVFERGVDLYLMPPAANASPEKLKIDLTRDYRFDPVEHKTFTKSADSYQLSPSGDYLALVVHGEVFVTKNDEEQKRTTRITKHPFRDQNAQWLNDSTLLFISDRSGNKEIYLVRSTDQEQSNLFWSLKLETIAITDSPEEEEGFWLSPDRQRILIRQGRGKAILAKIDSTGLLSEHRTLLDGWAVVDNWAWSPDSRWLAYSISDLNFNQEVFITSAEQEMEPVNVSMHPRNDGSPVWSPDGSKLGFLSIRNNGDYDVWFAWLRQADYEKTKADWAVLEEVPAKEEKEKGQKKKVVPVEIDLENIHERLVQVTRLPGNEQNLAISEDGATFFFTTNGGGRGGSDGESALYKSKWDGSKQEALKDKVNLSDLTLGPKGKNLYFINRGGTLGTIDVEGKKMKNLPFEAKMEINHEQERRQIFADAWKALEAGFYDPGFHGQDWKALRQKYEVRAINASTTQDFRAMFNEMLGQLNASHMGLFGSNPEETQAVRTGLLGLEVKPLEMGVRVERVVPGTPADRQESRLEPGEVILSVNGEMVHANQNFYDLLNGTVEERTLLEVQSGQGVREVIIRPASSLGSELYEAWVKERRRLTEVYSNGRLGYIHIQGMNWPSFERFERELMAAGYGKEGLVIDVRFNGGGWTTDMLMAVLNVRQHAYTIPRGAAESFEQAKDFRAFYPFGERLPLAAWTGPSVALCNQASYSNAEIFSHAFKTLDIGTLVGMPTFGAVISTGGHGLMDGSYVRMPFRAWFVKATDENMEHGSAVPDILVEEAPGNKARGKDDQLQKAVEVLLEEIGRSK